ncbi:MAG: HAMP domain-containing protein, partial [Bradyrhizobium sp.]|nr:HAMP domain-containing protein [Bradyrhizobium sp.]
NKLGLAGVVGVLLAVGLVANQLATESTVAAANDRTDRLQRVAESTLAAHLNMRQVQLAARGIRLARTPADIDTAVAEMRQFGAIEAREIDAALATARMAETRDRLQKIKALMASYSAGIEELAKAQRDLLAQIDKRTEISVEWAKAIAAQQASPALAKLDNRVEIGKLLLQADIKVNALQAMVWRLGATGDASLIGAIAKTQTALRNNFNELRGEADDRDLLVVISSLDKIVKRFLAANDEAVKIEELKSDIVKNRTMNIVKEAGELMEVAVSSAQTSMKASKEQVAAAIAQANRVSMIVAIVVVIALIASVIFSFLGVARPMTRLNGALGEMAGGNLDIAIPGADRGDEIGDLAKTVTVIRQNAEQKARDEAESKITQDQVAARLRKAEMIKLADDFEGAVG